jgi:hypothetical protein
MNTAGNGIFAARDGSAEVSLETDISLQRRGAASLRPITSAISISQENRGQAAMPGRTRYRRTPGPRKLFQMCGVFAEFERRMIVERVNAGLKRAKARGVRLGRGNRKDGARSADEARWGMRRAELEKRICASTRTAWAC